MCQIWMLEELFLALSSLSASLVTWTLITDSLKFRCKMALNVGDTPCLQNWSRSDRNPGRWLAGSPSGARSPPSVWLVGQVGDHSGWMALTSQATGSSPMTVPWLLPYRHQVAGAWARLPYPWNPLWVWHSNNTFVPCCGSKWFQARLSAEAPSVTLQLPSSWLLVAHAAPGHLSASCHSWSPK